MKEFINSTAVARVNGYIARKGSRGQLIEEIDKLGLPNRLKNKKKLQSPLKTVLSAGAYYI
jgi:hypothetical protein